ncbi:tRNA methyl transferase PRC-barrel domain-containing protein, partial [Actinomyces oris]|uniref:tRNA methyl transferase PRC-barrel domain-containing protein n=1 Tax=Actinomyces oris TaxID=544580 RepID=UPI0028E22156
ALGFDAVATGHYARLSGGAASGHPGDTAGLTLRRAVDTAKDQSYVLAVSGREGLARALFPLGDAPSKAQVRTEAESRGLPVASKPDSYDICFVADGDTRGFLARSLGAHEGSMVSPDGEVLGTHQGYFGFTVGQRKGLGLSRPAPDGRPRYVIETRPSTNEVVVGPEELLSRKSVDGNNLILLADPLPLNDGDLGWQDVTIQVRAHGRPLPADVAVEVETGTLRAKLHHPLRGLAAGQSVVVYGGDSGDQVLAQATVA